MGKKKIIIISEHFETRHDEIMCYSLFGGEIDKRGFMDNTSCFSRLYEGQNSVLEMIIQNNDPDIIVIDEYAGQELSWATAAAINSFREAGYKGKIIVIDNYGCADIDWKDSGADFSGTYSQIADFIKNLS
ncbi:hypothetical protein A2303_00605 [Candidatus Falkowbacteria bacterium RIFOXYB2_FULL_47_14]|uniref:Nucleoside 2-deoxyribosyltransferase n=1 Tax=Candidatus Falkowbacteria bacterium RIFOXYA2_FULL_47_19 TaxID=1797994 RepID=A0A1F5SMN9_9BACT|nr:MAG: hypothetical protein A2227_04010 [Candidatus Falkowbacteria bacterium RIFOXYA2_FULL_47_19]OGF34715.1 MAG: hypothetical protein A2468_02555 [Candidatus Falkowbacteria bacterium RIFOXYC2_FULL_46_15]OGF42873.1 MAG: hypothetical protein A2303_00605 [Candidatus Falkowbacteria bacterium RIFOXYB2_FULL_47_14]